MFKIISMLICFLGTSLHAEMFFTPEMIASHLKGYTDEEVDLINKDLNVVRSVCLQNIPTDNPVYLATAGGPGARKTTILEKFIARHPEFQSATYLDPDPRTLKFMVHTYYARSLCPLVISEINSYDEVIKKAYEKWRGGSNYIVLTLLEEALAEHRSIAYGTTSTGAHTPQFLAKLKENNYQVVLLLCSCSDSTRYEAVDYRNRVVRFYQSSPEDAVEKGLLFPQRMDAYFAHSDELYFYWSDSLFTPERLGGIWRNGKLEIHDGEAMQQFIDKYEADRAKLQSKGTIIPAFDTFL